MKNAGRKFLKLVFCFLTVMASLAILTLLSIAIWPQLLINEKTLKIAATWAMKKGIDIRWGKLKIRVDSMALLRKRLHLSLKDLCVKWSGKEIQACSKTLDLSLAASFSGWTPQLTELGPLDAKRIQWSVGRGKKKIRGILNFETGKETGSELSQRGQWNLRVFRLSGSAELPDHSSIVTRALVNLNRDVREYLDLGYFLDARYSKGKSRLIAHMEGDLNSEHWDGKFSASGAIEGVPKASLKNCDWDLSPKFSSKILKGDFMNGGIFTMTCSAQVEIPSSPIVKVPPDLNAVIRTDLSLSSFPPDLNTQINGPVEIILSPWMTSLYRVKGEIKTQIKGILGEFPDQWKIDSDLGIHLAVPHFEKVVKDLEMTDWAVPAPFAVLKGKLDLDLKGHTHPKDPRLPIQVKTQLSSRTQTLRLNGQGDLRVQGILFDLALSDVELELPRLDWTQPPPLFPDSRFSKPKVRQDSDFHYRLFIHTPLDRPAKIRSNLAQRPVPVHVNLRLSDTAPLEGEIRLEKFPVEFLRRRAEVNFLKLRFASPLGESPIEGSVGINYADYDMKISILSTLGKPQIRLSSEPVLPENQLVAALLFGRPLDELDQEQSSSVGNTRAALADGAIGLLSFYTLASTPIQSVGYDPQTKTVSAKVRLGEGTSLNLGAGTDTSTVGIRRRLSPFLSIETEVSRTSDSGEVATAYLEWTHRY